LPGRCPSLHFIDRERTDLSGRSLCRLASTMPDRYAFGGKKGRGRRGRVPSSPRDHGAGPEHRMNRKARAAAILVLLSMRCAFAGKR
jgi:hypothetical protein